MLPPSQGPSPSESGPDGQDVKHFAEPRQPGASGRLRTWPLNGHSLSRLAVLKHERLSASAGTVAAASPIGFRHQGPAALAPHLPAPCTATACQAHNASRMLTPCDAIAVDSLSTSTPLRSVLVLGPVALWAPFFKASTSPVVDSPSPPVTRSSRQASLAPRSFYHLHSFRAPESAGPFSFIRSLCLLTSQDVISHSLCGFHLSSFL